MTKKNLTSIKKKLYIVISMLNKMPHKTMLIHHFNDEKPAKNYEVNLNTMQYWTTMFDDADKVNREAILRHANEIYKQFRERQRARQS